MSVTLWVRDNAVSSGVTVPYPAVVPYSTVAFETLSVVQPIVTLSAVTDVAVTREMFGGVVSTAMGVLLAVAGAAAVVKV